MSKQKNLYEILGIEKTATEDEIKRAYRKLALKFHPDKNPDGDPLKTERFKEINHAHAILSNPQKRLIYDDYGEIGLKMADQFGEERMTCLLKPWVKWLFCSVAILTCFCFGCCCCQCCCNFCCGKCKPQTDECYTRERTSSPETIITTQPGANDVLYQSSSQNEAIIVGTPLATNSSTTPDAPSNNTISSPHYGATGL